MGLCKKLGTLSGTMAPVLAMEEERILTILNSCLSGRLIIALELFYYLEKLILRS